MLMTIRLHWRSSALATLMLSSGVVAPALLALLVAPSPCGAAEGLLVEHATVRPTFVPNGVSAAYFVIKNSSAAPDRLLAAKSPVANIAEVHTTIREGEVMKMRAAGPVEIKAGETIAFAPGGLHVMLVGVKDKLEEGARVPITLVFEKAGERTIEAVVKR